MRNRWFILAPLLLAAAAVPRGGAETIPPAPPRYFNDYSLTVSPQVVEELNQTLENFERETSNQIVVAVFRKADTNSSIEDYSNRVFRSWKVGGAAKNNGAALFVFLEDRKLRIEVNYGLEGAIPDATANQILDTLIEPKFRAGDFDGGLRDGVNALMAAARGEYKGTGTTNYEKHARARPEQGLPLWAIVLLVFLFFVIVSRFSGSSRGAVYDRRGYRNVRTGPVFWGGGFGGGGGSSGGGFDGGGFLGGSGMGGGGGASGEW